MILLLFFNFLISLPLILYISIFKVKQINYHYCLTKFIIMHSRNNYKILFQYNLYNQQPGIFFSCHKQ